MRLREVGWAIFLVGLPFSHLIFQPNLDIWHSHTLWAHIWIGILLSVTIWNQEIALTQSKALGALVAWILLSWVWQWNQSIIQGKTYAIGMAPGLLHLLAILGFYIAFISTVRIEGISRIMKWLARITWVIIGYCVLQFFSLDQFFMNLNHLEEPNDVVVGTIGNPTHLATHLSLLLPMVLLQKGKHWKVLASIIVFMLIFMLKSATGLAAAMTALIVWFWYSYRWVSFGILIACLITAPYAYLNTSWFNPHGRLTAWSEFWDIFKQRPITGFGPGFVMNLSHSTDTIGRASPIFQWRHVHQEFFQAAIEWGIIGFSLLSWFVIETINRARFIIQNPVGRACAAVFAAFLINCMLNFSAHLWATGSLGLLSICGIRVISEEYA